MDQENGSDSRTEPKMAYNVVDDDDTESENSDGENEKENGQRKASKGHQNVRQAHNPYTSKKATDGTGVSVACKGNKKGEKTAAPPT